MQDKRIFKETEQFASEEEQRESKWQQQYGIKIPEVEACMNCLLEEGTLESKQKLHSMFLDKEFFEHYKQTDMVAGMYIVMQIYEREQEQGIERGILEQGKTVKELLEYTQKLKFILYRIDFEVDTSSVQELVQFLKQHGTSSAILEIMMTTIVMRPLLMSLKLEEIFEWNHMYSYLFSILNFSVRTWKGNNRIWMRLADLYEKAGHQEYALECKECVPASFLEMCRQNPHLEKIQEYLWLIRYKEVAVCQGLTEEIKKGDITVHEWRELVALEEIVEAEYYLCLTEELLKNELKEYAAVVLRQGNQMIAGNELILCLLANLAIESERIQEAQGWLSQVVKPGKITYHLQSLCRNLQKGEVKSE